MDQVRAELWARYTASWVAVRGNPELTRARAQCLDDVVNTVRGYLNAAR